MASRRPARPPAPRPCRPPAEASTPGSLQEPALQAGLYDLEGPHTGGQPSAWSVGMIPSGRCSGNQEIPLRCQLTRPGPSVNIEPPGRDSPGEEERR